MQALLNAEGLTKALQRSSDESNGIKTLLNAIVVTGEEYRVFAGNLVDSLAALKPTRIFIAHVSDAEVVGSISGRCNKIDDEEICSEIVMVTGSLPRLAAFFRSNLVTGAEAQLLTFGSVLTDEFTKTIVPLADSFITDSNLLSPPVLLSRTNQVVDLSWLALSGLRDAVRALFEMIMAKGGVPPVVSITFSLPFDRMSSWLFVGWMMHQLTDLPLVVSGSSITAGTLSAQCIMSTSEMVRLACHEGHGEILLNDDVLLRAHGPLGDEERRSPGDKKTAVDLFERYLIFGESLTNYQASMEKAVLLRSEILPTLAAGTYVG